MHFVTLDSETDFEGWRKAARTLVLNRVNPFDVTWTLQRHEPELFDQSAAPGQPLQAPHGTFNISAKFIELAQSAVLHTATPGVLHFSIACCGGSAATMTMPACSARPGCSPRSRRNIGGTCPGPP